MFVPNFKILSQVVSEKSLTEKKLTDTQTNILTEKAKTIYPLYTSYTGGITMVKFVIDISVQFEAILYSLGCLNSVNANVHFKQK